MRLANLSMAVVAALSLGGCGLFDGSDPCSKADGAANHLTSAASACSGVAVPTLKGQSECETALAKCNKAEKAIVDEEMDCLSGVGACVAGQEKAFLADIAACVAPVAALSESCRSGFQL